LAVAVTDNPKIVAPVNENNNVIFLPHNNEIALEETFKAQGDEICAVIIEGIQGVGGIKEASKSFLQKFAHFATNTMPFILLIVCNVAMVVRDCSIRMIMLVLKPMYIPWQKGWVTGFQLLGSRFAPKFKPWHGELGTTFGGNHLACAAALAVLEIMEQENLMKNAEEIGNYLISALKTFKEVKEVRGRGLMIGIELPEELAHVKKELLFTHHIFTGEAKPNVIRLLPALNLTKEHADEFLAAFGKLVK
jgi:acetylornithine/N-succinyldiaminopimelate aminotransferase